VAAAATGEVVISMPYRIECVLECGNLLGGGPSWDVEEGRL
jgi:hypothetical protein